ncbi:LANO_0F14796g1_1 [Lachancea nothofagi CBS 11611]|uniref:LANO_0F14796g1_1 n=1 Tax=Lachancea nothofagi CBS 11611 TaxID=1266666 RepID=A0A1G4KCF0_9SACH|nr:LANO_0F14796g1_1 [Lachancea nothofagi CBS 11611]
MARKKLHFNNAKLGTFRRGGLFIYPCFQAKLPVSRNSKHHFFPAHVSSAASMSNSKTAENFFFTVRGYARLKVLANICRWGEETAAPKPRSVALSSQCLTTNAAGLAGGHRISSNAFLIWYDDVVTCVSLSLSLVLEIGLLCHASSCGIVVGFHLYAACITP